MADERHDVDDSPSERTSITQAADMRSRNFKKSIWKYHRRHLVALMAFLGFCNVYALRVNMSVAIVAMTSNQTAVSANGSTNVIPAEFPEWDSTIQGLILSSFFYGYIVSQIPAGFLAAKYGGARIFAIGVAATSALTILTPIFARTSLYLLVGARIIEGLFEGVTYPAIHALWARWAPPMERSKLATVAFSGSYFGTVISLPISGLLAETLGWPSIFVFFGIIALIWSIVWSSIVAETPSTDKYISDSELDFIRTSLGSAANNVKVNVEVPWKRILTSFPVWAIIIAHFSENWGFYTLLTELPTFIKDLVKSDIHEASILSAFPYLAMGIMVQVGGYLADAMRSDYRRTVTVRKLFNCGGFIFQTVFLVAAVHVPSVSLTIFFITVAVGCGGFAWAGFGVNHLDIAPPYASILMGLSNTFATLPGMISPILTGYLVTHKSTEEWQVVFYIAAGVYLIGAIFYGIFASGDEQSWARITPGLLRDDSSVTEDFPFGEASCE